MTPDDLKVAADLLDENHFNELAKLARRMETCQRNILNSGDSRRDYVLEPRGGVESMYGVAFRWLIDHGLIVKNKRKGKEHTWVRWDSKWGKTDE